jgi:uncharacterized protein YjbI with pentapeptide repeats
MANADDVRRLLEGVEVWNAWRKDQGRLGANPTGADLRRDRGTDLRRAKLPAADLSRADLRGARGANFPGADLSRVNLREVNLGGADLRGANLMMANLNEANLNRANLCGAFLVGVNLVDADLTKAVLIEADLGGADLREADLRWTVLRHAREANLKGAILIEADLRGTDLRRAKLPGADLCGANLMMTDLRGADLRGANLSGAVLNKVNLSRAVLSGANLEYAQLSDADLTGTDLTNCRVYGISSWGLKLSERTKQQDLVITPSSKPQITADDIEVAQFLYLLIDNKNIRKVIDTITSKVVLIIWRFSKERMVVLDAIRDELRRRDFLPVIFDFSIPASRDVTETVKVLAGLSRFVIADITEATEVRAELQNIIEEFTSLPVQPILLQGQPEYVGLSHLKNYPWLLPTFLYDTEHHLLGNLEKGVIAPAEAKVRELRRSADQRRP